jgi:glucan phosphoethanolaminetransferase (alkaline phosphatase superfamily)
MAGKVRRRILEFAVLGCLACAPWIVMLLTPTRLQDPRSIATLCATAILLVLLLAACTRTWRRFFLAYLPLLLVAAAYATYTVLFGGVPGETLALLILGATWDECAGLFLTWPHRWLLWPVLATLGAYLYLAWRLPDVPIFKGRAFLAARILLLAVVPLVAYAARTPARLVDGLALNPVIGSAMFFGGQLPLTNARLHGALLAKLPYHARRVGSGEEVHVLIVGESSRRSSWSVYGYARATTPYLDSIRDQLILFTDAVADANLTQYAVPIILTGVPPERLAATTFHGNLLDLAKEAGYSTTWLLNQDISITTALGIRADHFEFPPDPKPSVFGRLVQDGALLPAYARELARVGSPRFIALHIMGSHWEYYRRYPASFERFGSARGLNALSIALDNGPAQQALVDTYDNSILYTDWLLRQVIEQARALTVPATVTFIPDHGEELALFDQGHAGHGDPVYRPLQYQIPAFVWTNDAYRRSHPQVVAAIEHNAAREIRSHNVFYAMADLMGIDWPGKAPELSYASAQFVPDTGGAILASGHLVAGPASASDAQLAQSRRDSP